MNSFLQYTIAIMTLILTFLCTAMTLPTIIDRWQEWTANQLRRLKDKK